MDRDYEREARAMLLEYNQLQALHSEGKEVKRIARLLRCEAALAAVVAAYDQADEVASDDFRDAFVYRFDIDTARAALKE